MKICDSCRASYPTDTAPAQDGTTLRFSSELSPGTSSAAIRDQGKKIGTGGMASVYRAITWL